MDDVNSSRSFLLMGSGPVAFEPTSICEISDCLTRLSW